MAREVSPEYVVLDLVTEDFYTLQEIYSMFHQTYQGLSDDQQDNPK
jgi:hypothetical protein